MPSSELAATPNHAPPERTARRTHAPIGTIDWPSLARTAGWLGPLLVLFAWTFHFGLIRFWLRVDPIWAGDPDWGHALFIPIVGLFYLSAHRDELARCRVVSFLPGWIVLAAALLIYAYGLWTWNYFIEPGDFIQGIAIIVAIAAIVLILYGKQVFGVALFPIAFLLLANPWPQVFEDRLTLPLQHIAATGSVAILQMAGLSAEQSGNRVDIFNALGPPRTLNVAEACSGLRSVISFLAVATAVGFIPRRPLARKIAVVVVALPISVGANALRIGLQGIVDHFITQAVSSGTPHEIFGLLMMIPGLLALIAFAWGIDKLFHLAPVPAAAPKPEPTNSTVLPTTPPAPSLSLNRFRLTPYWSLIGVLAVSSIAVQHGPVALEAALGKQPVPLRQPLESLAERLGPWQQVTADTVLNPDVEAVLGANNYLIRTYYDTRRLPAGAVAAFSAADEKSRALMAQQWAGDDPGGTINVGVYYYTGRIDKVGHVPENCYVAAGFNQVGDPINATWTIHDKPLPYRFVHFEASRAPLPPRGCCVAYFFQVNGTYADNRLAIRGAMANVLQTHAYFAKVEMMSPLRDPNDAKRMMEDFVDSAIGPIEQILPGAPVYSHAALSGPTTAAPIPAATGPHGAP